jgi:hypothetical protein|tara:strand:+ start:571 stop:795 length:225 start_codon:yes stop_codon:yes gene_type:complete
MNFWLVLSSGLGFLAFTGFCLFFLTRANSSELPERSKKILMYFAVLIITSLGIFIFDVYTADHIAEYLISRTDQ